MQKKHPPLKHKKKKISWFYKVSFSLLVIAFTVLFYFVVIVSTESKSFPYVTEKIQENLRDNFGSDATLDESYVSFTRYGTLKITATNIKIFYVADLGNDKKIFLIPRLEAEFSLLDLLLLNFQPNKIRLVSPDIIISDLARLQNSQNKQGQQGQISILVDLFSAIQSKNAVEYLEIEDAILAIHSANFDQKILLRKSQIHFFEKRNIFNIEAQNQLSFDPEKSDVDFSFNCQLSENSKPRCDSFLTNFSPDSISNLHPSLNHLGKISAIFNASASFNISAGEIENFRFKVKSEKGSFEFLDFFSAGINFKNLNLAGEYDQKLKSLNFSNIETDFTRDDNGMSPRLSMSLGMSNWGMENEKSDFSIKMNDISGSELEKFWPINLNDNDIRTWVTKHINGGLVKEATAKFSLSKKAGVMNLDEVNAKINFSGLNLKYDASFPELSSFSGIAKFTQKDMKIFITEGKVLKSKISEAVVAIDDFEAQSVILKINSKLSGDAGDGLKHASNDKEFYAAIEKYLNGTAQSEVEINLSLSQEITLKNSYIAVKSIVSNLNNDYLHGGVNITAKKDLNSTSFVTNIDLTAVEISAKAFDILKKPLVESSLDFALLVDDDDNIKIKNISLVAKELQSEAKKNKEEFRLAKISGNMAINSSPFLISQLNLKNENFGKNNYNLSYHQTKKSAPKIISIKGEEINFGALIENKFFQTLEGDSASELKLQASFGRINLLRKKALRNFSLALNCKNNICLSGLAKANYGNKQMLNFIITKNPKNDFSNIEGRVSDIGYLAEALGISNVVSGGDAKIKLQNKTLKNKPLLEGEVTINNNITIYESATVKRLSKDTLFSSVKDKIFSSEKTIFDSVKLKFDINGELLNINSLVANNYKIGITSKGFINLKDESYQLKGMIIPGFIINNLFGIGNLPILGSLLTGGEGGGVFGIHYEYIKTKNDKEGKFTTNKVAAFVPSTIQNLFD